MRLLLAVHQFPPEYNAGTENLALRTAQELQRRGHRVSVLTGGDHDEGRSAVWRGSYEGVEVWRLNPKDPPPAWRGGILASYQRDELRALLDRVLEQERPELVQVFHLRRLTLTFLECCRARGLPVVLTLTDYWACCPTGQLMLPDMRQCEGPDPDGANCARHLAGRLQPRLLSTPLPLWRLALRAGFLNALRKRPGTMQQALSGCRAVLVSSIDMAQILARNGFNDLPLRVCPHAIEEPRLEELPPRRVWNPRERPLLIGFVGTLRPAKGALVLLEALQGWRGPALEVAIHGGLEDDLSYVDSLKQRMGRLPRMVSVKLMGTFPPRRLYAVLRSLDLLVVPSLWVENAPLIVLQSLAIGLPLVASSVPGIRAHLREGVDGLLFPPGDRKALAAVLHRLAASPKLLAGLATRPAPVRTMAQYVDDLEHHYRA